MCPSSDEPSTRSQLLEEGPWHSELLLAAVDSLHDGGEPHLEDPGHLQPVVSVVLAHRALEIALPAERRRQHPHGTRTDGPARPQDWR